MKTSGSSGFLSIAVVGVALILGASLRPGDVAQNRAELPTPFEPAIATDHIGLDEHAEPLRGSFNEDVGKVRVLMLVAPT